MKKKHLKIMLIVLLGGIILALVFREYDERFRGSDFSFEPMEHPIYEPKGEK